jgi:hypothetical protein
METILNICTKIIFYIDHNYLPYIRELYVYENNKYKKKSIINLYLNYYFGFIINYFLFYKLKKRNYIVLYKINNNYNYKIFEDNYIYNVYNYKFNNNNKLIIKKPIKSINIIYEDNKTKTLNNLIKYLYMFEDNSKIKEILLFNNNIFNNVKYIDINFLRDNKRLNKDDISSKLCIDIFK